MIDIHTEQDPQRAATHAAAAITDALSEWKGPVLLLFSGGSPLEILKVLSTTGIDARVTVGVSDERFSTDPAINNFAQIMQTPWYKTTMAAGAHVIDTRPADGETVERLGFRFDAALKAWTTAYPDGKIILTQGIGLDGHTAGMMPYPEDPALFERMFDTDGVWSVGYNAGEKNKFPFRVTTTIPFLKKADLSVVFVCGPDKRTPLGAVLSSVDSVAAVPGRIIHHMKHCLLYTDQTIDRVNT